MQVLNERSISDRDILVTRQQYEDLKQGRKDLKSATNTIERQAREIDRLEREKTEVGTVCERLKTVMETMEERRQVDNRHLQELTTMNAKLTSELKDAQRQNSEQHRQSEIAVSKLRSSLTDIQSVLEYRAAVGQRELSKCLRVLTQDLSSLLDIVPYFSQKPQILGLIQTTIGYVDGVKRLLSSNRDRNELETDEDLEKVRLLDEVKRLRESSNSTQEYVAALEKMKEQTRLIKERLRLMEGDFPYKKAVEEYEGRLQLLSSEKEMLTEHVHTLQATLSEQCSVIEHLKGIIASLASASPSNAEPRSLRVSPVVRSRSPGTQGESLSVSPEPMRSKLTNSSYSPLSRVSHLSGDRDINQEIEALDRDIQTLQTSLQRALQQY